MLTDVDGVLTDGGMYYTDKGEVMKKFHTRDGMGMALLKKNNISTIIITKEKTKIVISRAKKLPVNETYVGIKKKESLLPKICKKYKIEKNNVAYIGDDVNDLEIMKHVGFSISPKDGIKLAKEIADYVCAVKGGEGVFREVADLILEIQHPKKKDWY